MDRKYYVYEHREADTGRTFYVGKGSGGRSGNAFHRSAWWKKIVAKHGFTVHRIYENLTENDALSLEASLIEAHGRENLCNLTDGGEGGLSGYTHTQEYKDFMGHARKNKEVHKFTHPEHGEFIGTRHDLYLKFNLTKADRSNISDMVLNGRYAQVKGWGFEGNTYKPRFGNKSHRTDLDVYSLINKDGSFYSGGRHAFCEAIGMAPSNFSGLKSGVDKSYKGWSLV